MQYLSSKTLLHRSLQTLFFASSYNMKQCQNVCVIDFKANSYSPGPQLTRIHLVRNSTSAKFQKSHLVRPIIHLVQIFALSN